MIINTTLGTSRTVSGIYTPESIEELKLNFLKLRSENKFISIVSKGNNWGYGCHAPNADQSLLINLEKCHRILNFDSYHGTVTIEPGVTYGQLAAFLKEKNDEWIAPVHGGGPDCSIIGNCLERGYGITPYTDHFGAVLSLSALLSNGEMYFGALKKLGQEKLDKLFKYGIGPYTDGLFSQSGLGIVTEITLKLAPNPKYLEMFYFTVLNEDEIPDVVEAIKKTKRELGTNLGGINLMNKERLLSMILDYPIEKIKTGEPLSTDEIEFNAHKLKLTPWLIVGMLYGEKEIVKASKKLLLKNFKNIKKRTLFYNSTNHHFIQAIGKTLSFFGATGIPKMLQTLEEALSILKGEPSKVALRLAYWKNENKELVKQDNLNPNRDGCGLIWYAPLVEMKPEEVTKYIKFVRAAAMRFNINPLITLTTIDDLCFDSTIPILFNMKNEKEKENAKQYYHYLLTEGAKLGFFPYRLNIETQNEYQIHSPLTTIEPINSKRYQ